MKKTFNLLLLAFSFASIGQQLGEEIPCTRWGDYDRCQEYYSYRFDYKTSDGVCYCVRTKSIWGFKNGDVTVLMPPSSHTWVTNLEAPSYCPCDSKPKQQDENDGDTQRYEMVLEEVIQTSDYRASVYSQEIFGFFVNDMVWRVHVFSAGGGSHWCDFDHNPSYHEIVTCMYSPETLGNN